MSDGPSPLNARQRAFVRAYTSGKTIGVGTLSAKKAGYTGSDAVLAVTASDLLRVPKVAAAIREREQNAEDASVMDRYEREQLLSAIARGEETEERAGNEGVQVVMASLKDRIKAAELLGRMGGDFVERREITGKDGAPLKTETAITITMSQEATRELAAKGTK